MSYRRIGKTGNKEERAEMRIKAYQGRLKRKSYREIGEELGVSRTTVMNLINEYTDALTTPLAEKARSVEGDKLDGLEAVAWQLLEDHHVVVSHGKVVLIQDAVTGEKLTIKDSEPVFKAINAILKIQERRARLWGLDMPTRSEHTVTSASPVDDSIQKLIDEMNERNDQEQSA